MHFFRLGLGVWVRRLLARHPLVRLSDRIEAASLLVVVVLAMAAVPVAGAAGTAVHDNLSHTVAAQRAERQQFEATVTGDSTALTHAYDNPYLSTVQWQFNGVTRTDEVRTADLKAGDHVQIWIDATGHRTPAPLTDRDAAAQAVIAAAAAWSVAAGLAVAGWALLRLRLNRGRYADWDRELDDLADDGGRKNRST